MATARAEPSPSAAARLQPLPPLRVALGAVARGPCFPPCFTYRQKGAESARPAAARPEQMTATAGKGRPRQTLTARPPPPPKRAVPFISASSPARSELSRSLAPRRPRSRARTPRPPGAGASAEGGRRPAAQSPRAESLLSDVRGGGGAGVGNRPRFTARCTGQVTPWTESHACCHQGYSANPGSPRAAMESTRRRPGEAATLRPHALGTRALTLSPGARTGSQPAPRGRRAAA